MRILSLPLLPLMAIPLAIDRVRGQRSYGLVVGLAMLIAFHQLLQVGEALADNNKISVWVGLWLPLAVFAAISAWMFVRAATRVPDPAPRHLARSAVRPPRAPAAAAAERGCRPRMSVLAVYLNRMFLVRFLVVLFGIIGFATVIDLIDVGPELVSAPEGALAAGLRYFGLRLPIMLSELMPLAALLAGLLAVADLLRHRELIVVWSIGVRPLTILRMLLPAGLALVAVKFAVDDLAVPHATSELRLWGIGDYRHRPTDAEAGGFYWLRSGQDIVRLSANAIATGKVSDLSIFRRGADGILTERIDAASATDIPGGWRLHEVTRSPVDGRSVERFADSRLARAASTSSASSSWPARRASWAWASSRTSSRPAATACARRSPT